MTGKLSDIQLKRRVKSTPALGTSLTSEGCHFSLYSEHATSVWLCLFAKDGKETQRIPLQDRAGGRWFTFVKGITEGQLYGYRVAGPNRDDNTDTFNPNKLLIDPYARSLTGNLNWHVSMQPQGKYREMDSAPWVPKAIVQRSHFDWEGVSASPYFSHRTYRL